MRNHFILLIGGFIALATVGPTSSYVTDTNEFEKVSQSVGYELSYTVSVTPDYEPIIVDTDIHFTLAQMVGTFEYFEKGCVPHLMERKGGRGPPIFYSFKAGKTEPLIT